MSDIRKRIDKIEQTLNPDDDRVIIYVRWDENDNDPVTDQLTGEVITWQELHRRYPNMQHISVEPRQDN
jgi:hypothetical protein